MTVESNDLIKISGTLKNDPEYHYPVRGSSYARIDLKNYSNREFYFYVPTYSIKSLKRNNFFQEVKAGDRVKLTIPKDEYENKIKNLQYPTTWQFVNVFINTLGIESDNKVYTSFNDFNSAYKKDGKIGYFFPLAGITLIIGYLFWKKKKKNFNR